MLGECSNINGGGNTMIEKLTIENFRSYQKVEFDFAKGINCIIGLPDSGKTNIIRALKWVLTNRPLGKRMLSNFTDDPTLVSVGLMEGNVITLSKDKKSVYYKLNKTELKAIGSDVPDIITDTANIGELNFQKQLDKPFLICESPGEVAKIFNKITRLEKPDRAISTLTTDINSENKMLKQLKIDELDIKSEIESLGNVKEIDADFKVVEGINKMLVDIAIRKSELNILINKIEKSEKVKNDIGLVFTKMKKDLDELLECEKKHKKIEDECEELSDRVDVIIQMEHDVKEKKEVLINKAKQFRNFLNTIKVCPFCDKCKAPISAHNLDEAIKGVL
jgi:DNA repair protein SbcC/Rad50